MRPCKLDRDVWQQHGGDHTNLQAYLLFTEAHGERCNVNAVANFDGEKPF